TARPAPAPITTTTSPPPCGRATGSTSAATTTSSGGATGGRASKTPRGRTSWGSSTRTAARYRRRQLSVTSEGIVAPWTAPQVPLSLPDKPSIAVLPFLNMTGDPDQEYFADGMAEEIIAALSRFLSPVVIARNSSFTYKGRAVDIKRVGRELGVRYVLE